ncbi:MAG: hypothetical protein K6E83_01825 [Clostridium sp.]|nr:hypothetical protein [Clostridium sp.]
MKRNLRLILFPAALCLMMLSPCLFLMGGTGDALSGAQAAQAFPRASVRSVLDGSYQDAFDGFLDQNLPGRSVFIRLRNQALYRGAGISPNNSFVLGENDNLFSREEIASAAGASYTITGEEAEILAGKLIRLRDLLRQTDRELYLFVTPSKVRYYPGDIPSYLRPVANPQANGENYRIFTKALEKTGIPCFDSIAWIDGHREELADCGQLFPATGHHWSVTVGNRVGYAFGRWLAEESGRNLPELSLRAVPAETPVFPDADLYDALNLTDPAEGEFYDTRVTVLNADSDRPDVLLQGGSFMGQSLFFLIPNGFFGKNAALQNKVLYMNQLSEQLPFEQFEELPMAGLMQDIDMVVLEVNERSIPSMSFGFIDFLLDHPDIITETTRGN